MYAGITAEKSQNRLDNLMYESDLCQGNAKKEHVPEKHIGLLTAV